MKLSNDVLAVLDRSTTNGNALRLPEQLDRPLYEAVAKVIEAAGGKWNRKAKAHLFDDDAGDAIEPVILTGEVTNRKQEFGQFDTPPPIVEMIINQAIKLLGRGLRDVRLLEPSAGNGAIATRARDLSAIVDCIEIDPKRCHALRTLRPALRSVTQSDFLRFGPFDVYDVVLMNPTFAKQADIDHVEHATKFLRPGGVLVSVMSAGVTFRENGKTRRFRHEIECRGGYIDLLPEGSFAASGTNVNTALVSVPAAR